VNILLDSAMGKCIVSVGPVLSHVNEFCTG